MCATVIDQRIIKYNVSAHHYRILGGHSSETLHTFGDFMFAVANTGGLDNINTA